MCGGGEGEVSTQVDEKARGRWLEDGRFCHRICLAWGRLSFFFGHHIYTAIRSTAITYPRAPLGQKRDYWVLGLPRPDGVYIIHTLLSLCMQ